MKFSQSNMVLIVLSMFFLILASLDFTVASVGVCYGMLGNNLPTKQDVVALYQKNGITRMRIYDANLEALEALRGSNIEVSVGVPNEILQKLASNQVEANAWVQKNIKNYANVRFRYIVVANEFRSQFLLGAMQNLLKAVSTFGLRNKVKVTTAIDTTLLGVSNLPSQGMFRADASGFIAPIAKFLVANGSPLLVNMYPYKAYVDSKGKFLLDYALFKSPGVVVKDGALGYQNLFDAMIDTFHSALEKVGAGSLDIVVSGTGWPTSGGNATSLENQKSYVLNLIDHVKGTRGTPKRPGKFIETYIFAMFDENQKTPVSEKFWGLFTPNKQIKYPIKFV
ncbi:glucan endo-1,3-beta-glucosidase, basic isoform-like [Impatiens glandulifera]|uniref:glucan endo-1,3-beta-glucosidase, basic isoform-like n=1 Tax=Impatiens glandulifera TaxID=253017 RepID=UPI001FB13C1C|nr:glucan endo-1,3-beta-glucosidase, basic isoform-like [Impatiens glandulifera]